MEKLKTIINFFIGIIVIGVFAFIFFKGSILTIWMTPDNPVTYAIYGEDGRILKMVTLPDNEAIWYFSNSESNDEEYALVKMLGSYGTHYFWRIWNISGSGVSLGYRIYPEDVQPVRMESHILNKYKKGTGDSSFPKIDNTTHSTFLFKEDAVKFEGMWLEKEDSDEEFINHALNLTK